MSTLILEAGEHRKRLSQLMATASGVVRVASAYVTDKDLLTTKRPNGCKARLLTSLSVMDIVAQATSLDSLEKLMAGGVECRYMEQKPKFHAKVYLFDNETAVVTSANLTISALNSNIEVGTIVDGAAARELAQWYERCWDDAYPITSTVISAFRKRTQLFSEQYRILRMRIRANMPTFVHKEGIPNTLNLKLERPLRWFYCNTNRRYGKLLPNGRYREEIRMKDENRVLAWEPFRSLRDIKAVTEGDVILMYAKGKGVIGVGQVKSESKTRGDRITDAAFFDSASKEWQIPVEWLVWEYDDQRACPWGDTILITFKDISAEKFKAHREKVIRHFFGDEEAWLTSYKRPDTTHPQPSAPA